MVNWSEGGKGAAGGALAGGTIGSVAGPYGTVIGAGAGAIIGGAAGLFGGDDPSYTPDRSNFNLPGYSQRGAQRLGTANWAMHRQAPQSAATTIGRFQNAQGGNIGESDFRANQQNLANALYDQYQGKGPSLAAEQLKQSTNRNLAAARSLNAGARGPMSALAARNTQNQLGSINQQAVNESVMARIQERMAAGGLAGQMMNTGRGQDLQRAIEQQQLNAQLSQFNAGQQNQRTFGQAQLTQSGNQFNVDARLRQTGLNDQAMLEALRQEMQNAQLQQYGSMGYEAALGGKYEFEAGRPTVGDQFLAAGSSLGAAKLGQKS